MRFPRFTIPFGLAKNKGKKTTRLSGWAMNFGPSVPVLIDSAH